MDAGINTYAEGGIEFGKNQIIFYNIVGIEADEYSHDKDGDGVLYITTSKAGGL